MEIAEELINLIRTYLIKEGFIVSNYRTLGIINDRWKRHIGKAALQAFPMFGVIP